MNIKLVSGDYLNLDEGKNVAEAAKSISNSLAKNAIAGKVNDKVVDLTHVLKDGDTLQILTWNDEEGKHALRHTASHIMAQAVKRLYPDVKVAIGPSIENGFYYDFEFSEPIKEEDLASIEKEMHRIVKENDKLERFIMSRDEAIAYFQEQNQDYKVELIRDLPEDEEISFYKQGDFTDLCAGPHVTSTGKVKNLKIMSLAGAYWRGDEKNKMLQRIYGTAFPTKEELDDYLNMLEEAKKRDHRKLGKQLDLFGLMDEGPGFPFFFPKGMILRNILEDYWRQVHTAANYQEIKTPLILRSDLWHQSGHWDHYKENMYFSEIDGDEYAIKPMNCPGAMLSFKRRIYSYRDLPLRLCEMGTVHRHEKSGALHGLMRVRCFTQDDAHIFMEPQSIQSEVLDVIKLTEKMYSLFGYEFHLELSTRPDNSMGSDEDWENATNSLITALNQAGLPYTVNEGDGAFYGPKIDFHLKDSIGRTWQCGTVQLDFQMPERFDLTYVGNDGEKHRPVIIHRVVYGSIERFIGIMTEHFAGAFPLWLAPVQAKIMTVTGAADEAAFNLQSQLLAAGFRVELDVRNEKIGFKIREAQLEKIPYMLVLGEKEAENGQVSVRYRSKGDIGSFSIDDLSEMMNEEVKGKMISR